MTKKATLRLVFLVGVLAAVSTAQTQGAGPYNFYSVTPCRIADTRNPSNAQGTGGGPLVGGMARNFPIAGQCGVPTDAKAAALNVTVVSPTLEGYITIWPYNTPFPVASTINFTSGEPAIANGAIVPLGADATFHISVVYGTAPGGNVDLILDVTGFFK
jgi:hypothetical protein